MKERPILFSSPMVRAILEGRSNDDRRIWFNDADLRAKFDSGMTAAEIAAAYGCSPHPVKKALGRLGLRRPAKRRIGKGCGSANPAWKGGRRIRSDGYVIVWTPNGERLEHRIVMEAKLRRQLKCDEIVHHLNADKRDNRPENLEVMTQSEHARHHSPEMHAARYYR